MSICGLRLKNTPQILKPGGWQKGSRDISVVHSTEKAWASREFIWIFDDLEGERDSQTPFLGKESAVVHNTILGAGGEDPAFVFQLHLT